MTDIPDVSPLTVWVGSVRHVFAPGRDVTVGHGGHCDVPLEATGTDGAAPPIRDVVLRFAGTHWLAVDQSHHGLFLDGVRMSTIDIRDGLTITLGDPHRGPRLTFQVTAPDDTPAPITDPIGVKIPAERPAPVGEPTTTRIRAQPAPSEPVEPETTRIQAQPAPVVAVVPEPETTRIQAQPALPSFPVVPPQHSPLERPTRPFRYLSDDPATEVVPAKGLVERMTEATRKLLPTRTDPGAESGAESGPGALTPQTNRLPLLPGARTIGVAAHDLGLTVEGHQLLSNVSFTSLPGSLLAVVGPSAARNFALTGLLNGTRSLSSGILTVDGHDVHAEPQAMRFRVGVVARDNRVHPGLTVERALDYAAELRLPPNTPPESRDRVVNQVLDELELTPHRGTKVANLPPEALRCASLAVELLTRPSLLVVDGPGAGLDPGQEAHVMVLLRRQADLGCVVVVAGAALTHLNLCDQVLVLTPAGQLAFAGPPAHLEPALGSTDWSEIFARISADPYGAHHAFLVRQHASVSPTPPSVARPERLTPELGFGRQFRILARRQLMLLLASPVYSLFLLLLPFALGALTLLIPGHSGLGRAGPLTSTSSSNTHEALEILAALNFAAVVMGTAVSIRDLVAERRIFRREQKVGLSTSAYLLAKIVVFGLIAAGQAAILTTIVIAGKGGPQHGALLLGNADVELFLSVAATAVVSTIVGLALSAIGKSMGEVLPLAVPAVLASLLFAGGLASLVGTWGYDQISWFVPAQWGFAAAAATVDLHRVDRLAEQNALWAHYSGWWVFDMLMLVVFGVAWAGFARFRLRPPITSRATGTA